MKSLILVRHGETYSNIIRALDTAKPGAPLDHRGRGQAYDVAKRWNSVVGIRPGAVAVSPLTRTRQTAEPLIGRFGPDVFVADGIREVLAGNVEMSNQPDDIVQYLTVSIGWAQGLLDVRMPGGETGWEVLARSLPVVDEVLKRADNGVGVLVTHGTIARVLATHLAADLPAGVVATHPMGNARLTWLTFDGDLPDDPAQLLGAFSLRLWDETAPAGLHLPDGPVRITASPLNR